MAALNHLVQLVLHVVAQIVEAVFVIGAVGYVGPVGVPALVVVEAVYDHPDAQPEELVDLAHPLGIASGQVIVHRDHMHALAGESIEIAGQGRDERLALAGPHLGDGAFVQHHAADQLDIEMPLAEHALGRFAHRGESRNQKVVERPTLRQLLAERDRAGRQRLVAERRNLGLEIVDRRHVRRIGLQTPGIGRAEDLLGERSEHQS